MCTPIHGFLYNTKKVVMRFFFMNVFNVFYVFYVLWFQFLQILSLGNTLVITRFVSFCQNGI